MRLNYPSLAVLALALVLFACGTRPAEIVLASCNTYQVVLAKVNENFDKFSDKQLEIIDGTRRTLNGVCLGDAPGIDENLRQSAVSTGVALLTGLLGSVGVQ